MAKNIEIKATMNPNVDQKALVEKLAGSIAVELTQEDIFFNCQSGRLKLRIFNDGRGELIAYHRPDTQTPTGSDYHRTNVAQPMSLRTTLAKALGIRGVVRKLRTLYIHDHVRIHLDQVEQLGHFIELEAVLQEGETEAAGLEKTNRFMQYLKIDRQHLVAKAYIDLLEAKTKS